jgi:hypothetical protein
MKFSEPPTVFSGGPSEPVINDHYSHGLPTENEHRNIAESYEHLGFCKITKTERTRSSQQLKAMIPPFKVITAFPEVLSPLLADSILSTS